MCFIDEFPGSANLTGITNGTSNNHVGTVAVPLNPRLGALTNNGGPTPTEAPLLGSPVIDAGVSINVPANTATDQRGATRVVNGVADIGAVEFQDAALTVAIAPASGNVPVGGTASFAVTVTNTSGHALPTDNSILSVTLSSGLTATSPLTFILAPLAAGQSQTFNVTATATTLGTQTLTAALTSPDATPSGVLASTQINVITPPPQPLTNPTTPVGTLTLFAIGFGPTGIDLFEVDRAGDIFAVSLTGGGPIFLNTGLHLPTVVLQDGRLLALLAGANGQDYVIDIIDPFLPSIEAAVFAALRL
jgi:hypothetical protein